MVRTGFFAASALFVVTQALAQTASPPPAGSQQVIPEKQSTTPLHDGRSDSLSTKLSKSGGVITPNSDIDPGMHVPAPDAHTGSTPVIPPSATGGNTAK